MKVANVPDTGPLVIVTVNIVDRELIKFTRSMQSCATVQQLSQQRSRHYFSELWDCIIKREKGENRDYFTVARDDAGVGKASTSPFGLPRQPHILSRLKYDCLNSL